jgi:site-specific DNA-methyltransferase (adenine-specific)
MTVSGTIHHIDAFQGINLIPDGTVDAVITDPPYFLDGMGDTWNHNMIGRKTTTSQTVSSLRSGMKFDKKQGVEFQTYMNKVAEMFLPKLKPGGWFIAFSAPRLYHRLAVGVEDAGYEVRDMWEWLYTQNQMKAMNVFRGLKNLNIS